MIVLQRELSCYQLRNLIDTANSNGQKECHCDHKFWPVWASFVKMPTPTPKIVSMMIPLNSVWHMINTLRHPNTQFWWVPLNNTDISMGGAAPSKIFSHEWFAENSFVKLFDFCRRASEIFDDGQNCPSPFRTPVLQLNLC